MTLWPYAGIVCLGLIIGSYIYGHHVATAEWQAKSQQAVISAQNVAKAAQAKADASTEAQLAIALKQANDAVLTAKASQNALQSSLSRLAHQEQINAKASPTILQWQNTTIPAGALVGMCFRSQDSGSTTPDNPCH